MMKSLSIFRLSVLLIVLPVSLNLAADNEEWSSFNRLHPFELNPDVNRAVNTGYQSSYNDYPAGGQESANNRTYTPSRFKLPTIGGDVQQNNFNEFMQTESTNEAYLYNTGDVKYYDMNKLTQLYDDYTQQLLASGNSPKDIPSLDTFVSWFNTTPGYAAPIGDGVDVVIFLLLLSVGYIAYTRRKESSL